ncbi:MAG: DNA repair protein RecO [Pseudomonadota bacterium]
MKATLEPGYVLHLRPWRESSLLVEFFSRSQGRVALVARGAKSGRSRGGSVAALLQPFTPLQCSWRGRGQLRNLGHCESLGPSLRLPGRRLYSGLYMNELLVRLLYHDDPHQKLFDHYAAVLALLAGDVADSEEIPLRRFELVLLEELGYGFDLSSDGLSGEALDPDAWYHYQEEYGLVHLGADASPERQPQARTQHRMARFLGADLLALSKGDYSGGARLCAKRLMRQALAAHLGDKPLNSRDLFRQSD